MRPARPLSLIDIKALTDAVSESWKNFPLTENNDHGVRVSVMDRDFHWHAHLDSDETFLVLEGELLIDVETGTVGLKPGQMLTMPRGERHRTRAVGRTVTLTFERRDTDPTGD